MDKITLKNGNEIESGNVVELKDGKVFIAISAGKYLALVNHITHTAEFHFKEDRPDYEFDESKITKVYNGLAGQMNISGLHNKGNYGSKFGRIKWEAKNYKIVKLNDEYEARVEGGKVTVGCQVIPISKLYEIINAAEELDKA